MIDDNVRVTFGSKIDPIEDTLNIGNGATVSVIFFANLFKDAPAVPTYDDLVLIDSGRLGYIPFFDQCKNEGILL